MSAKRSLIERLLDSDDDMSDLEKETKRLKNLREEAQERATERQREADMKVCLARSRVGARSRSRHGSEEHAPASVRGGMEARTSHELQETATKLQEHNEGHEEVGKEEEANSEGEAEHVGHKGVNKEGMQENAKKVQEHSEGHEELGKEEEPSSKGEAEHVGHKGVNETATKAKHPGEHGALGEHEEPKSKGGDLKGLALRKDPLNASWRAAWVGEEFFGWRLFLGEEKCGIILRCGSEPPSPEVCLGAGEALLHVGASLAKKEQEEKKETDG